MASTTATELEPTPALITTDLRGRVANINLPATHALMPLFETVVNSIQAIDEAPKRQDHSVAITILRSGQGQLREAGEDPLQELDGFRVEDMGIGFTDQNFEAFCTLDTRIKVKIGGKGVGRLLWLN